MRLSDLWIVVATVLYLIVLVWAYFNRGSERVVTTVFLGLAAILGALLAVAVFNAEPAMKKVFSTVVTIDKKTHLPYGLPFPAISAVVTVIAKE